MAHFEKTKVVETVFIIRKNGENRSFLFSELPKWLLDSDQILIESNPDYCFTELSIIRERPETDEELLIRTETIQKNIMKSQLKDYERYLELKKRYESDDWKDFNLGEDLLRKMDPAI